LLNCYKYEVLKEKVKYLIKTVSEFSLGTTNLNAVLSSQRCAVSGWAKA